MTILTEAQCDDCDCALCKLKRDLIALLSRPLPEVPVWGMTIEEVRKELEERGIDASPLVAKVKAKLAAMRAERPSPVVVSGWISVNDKLPIIPEGKYGIEVLVNVHDPIYHKLSGGQGDSVSVAFYGSTRDKQGMPFLLCDGLPDTWFTSWASDGDGAKVAGHGDPVTHWMPLPEPPCLSPVAGDADPLKPAPAPGAEEVAREMKGVLLKVFDNSMCVADAVEHIADSSRAWAGRKG
jgi:hypothetical protein